MVPCIVYTRPDGVIGVGFLIVHGALRQHSVAWPDRKCERFTIDELERHGIEADIPEGLEEPQGIQAIEPTKQSTQTFKPTPDPDPSGTPGAIDVAPGAGPEPSGDGGAADSTDGTNTQEPSDADTTPENDPPQDPGSDPEPAVTPPAGDAGSDAQADVAPVETDGPADSEDASAVDSETDGVAVDQPEEPATPLSEAEAIRQKLAVNANASNKEIREQLAAEGVQVSSSQITRERNKLSE